MSANIGEARLYPYLWHIPSMDTVCGSIFAASLSLAFHHARFFAITLAVLLLWLGRASGPLLMLPHCASFACSFCSVLCSLTFCWARGGPRASQTENCIRGKTQNDRDSARRRGEQGVQGMVKRQRLIAARAGWDGFGTFENRLASVTC
eukprot:6188317-Pleurochrysis_carterae.AAC.1